MNWKKLISNKRFGQEDAHPRRHDDRSEFKRDYDRLIFSSPFRRLQNKTQVFPLPGSVFVHNRLTHSLEVASVGQSLANDIAQGIMARQPELKDTLFPEIGTIVATSCLAHDLGNPPFGHSGEKAIQTFFSEGNGLRLKDKLSEDFWQDITHFEGNSNAFRLLTHRFNGRRSGGFVMTYSSLAAIVKYPYSSAYANDEHEKYGFFCSESEYFKKIADDLGMIRLSAEGEPLKYARHPLVYIVEAADDICYEIMDIEDAFKMKLLSFEETQYALLSFFDEKTQNQILLRIQNEGITDDHEKVVYMRARVIGILERECAQVFIDNEELILQGKFEGTLISNLPERLRSAYKICQDLSYAKIYRSKPVVDIEMAGFKIMATLMEQFTEAVVHPERFYSQQLIKRVSNQYDIENENFQERIAAVIDYVSGMTDVYALDVFEKINGLSLPIV